MALVDMEFWCLTKVAWSYNHDVISIFQISLKQIGAFESYYCPKFGGNNSCWHASYCFLKLYWSYRILTISTVQVSLNLFGVFYAFGGPTLRTLALVERKLMVFSESHMVLQLSYYHSLLN